MYKNFWIAYLGTPYTVYPSAIGKQLVCTHVILVKLGLMISTNFYNANKACIIFIKYPDDKTAILI